MMFSCYMNDMVCIGVPLRQVAHRRACGELFSRYAYPGGDFWMLGEQPIGIFPIEIPEA